MRNPKPAHRRDGDIWLICPMPDPKASERFWRKVDLVALYLWLLMWIAIAAMM